MTGGWPGTDDNKSVGGTLGGMSEECMECQEEC